MARCRYRQQPNRTATCIRIAFFAVPERHGPAGFSGYDRPVSIAVPSTADATYLDTVVDRVGGTISRIGTALSGVMRRV